MSVDHGEALDARIRSYERRDAAEIVRLFYETVHAMNRADYSPEQLAAWAPGIPDPEDWHERLGRRYTLVAEEAGEVVAFAELENGRPDALLDMLYVRRDAVGRGVGSRLYREVEREARGRGVERISTEASVTARPFFERRGFSVLREQSVVRGGVELKNFAMHKRLEAARDAGSVWLCIMPACPRPRPVRGVSRCS